MIFVKIKTSPVFEITQKDLMTGLYFKSVPLILSNHERPAGLNKI